MNNKLLLFLFIIGSVFGYTIYETSKLEEKFSSGQTTSGSVLKNYPETAGFTVFDSNSIFLLNNFKSDGDILVVHFWATWCGPCEVEFPDLLEFMKLVKDNTKIKFLFVAVSDQKEKILKFLKKYKAEYLLNVSSQYALVQDNKNELNKFGTFKLPESYVFGTKNTLIRKLSGQQPWTQQFMLEFFGQL